MKSGCFCIPALRQTLEVKRSNLPGTQQKIRLYTKGKSLFLAALLPSPFHNFFTVQSQIYNPVAGEKSHSTFPFASLGIKDFLVARNKAKYVQGMAETEGFPISSMSAENLPL